MRIFLSAGEPSGDLHGSNLVLALRRIDPAMDCVGFGGERMQAAGCRLLFPLCQLAVMGLIRVLLQVPLFLRLLLRADRYFRRKRPDAVVLIDYPGFHWWLARRAHAHGIPVFYFVPPQIWAWASGRIQKMRRWVDHVLCSLPFEETWYRERGVEAQYIGHPYFDELAHQRLDQEFVNRQQAGPGTIIGLLPGSRTQEVEFNLSTLTRAATRIHETRPDTRFLVACYKQAHEEHVRQYLQTHALPFIETCSSRTAEILQLAHSCIAVSGSVGLELLFRGKPSVVVYRLRRLLLFLVRIFKKSPYISLVNLLAGKTLFPEFLTARDESEAIAGHVLRWLNDPKEYVSLQTELAVLRQRVAEPGACERAARFIIQMVTQEPDIRRKDAA